MSLSNEPDFSQRKDKLRDTIAANWSAPTISTAKKIEEWLAHGYRLEEIERTVARLEPNESLPNPLAYINATLEGRAVGGWKQPSEIAGQILRNTLSSDARPPQQIWIRDKDAECLLCDLRRKGFKHQPGDHTCGHYVDGPAFYAAIRAEQRKRMEVESE